MRTEMVADLDTRASIVFLFKVEPNDIVIAKIQL